MTTRREGKAERQGAGGGTARRGAGEQPTAGGSMRHGGGQGTNCRRRSHETRSRNRVNLSPACLLCVGGGWRWMAVSGSRWVKAGVTTNVQLRPATVLITNQRNHAVCTKQSAVASDVQRNSSVCPSDTPLHSTTVGQLPSHGAHKPRIPSARLPLRARSSCDASDGAWRCTESSCPSSCETTGATAGSVASSSQGAFLS